MEIDIRKVKPGDTFILINNFINSSGKSYKKGTEVVFLGHISHKTASLMVKVKGITCGAFMVPISKLKRGV